VSVVSRIVACAVPAEIVAFTADDRSTKKVSLGSWMPSPSIVTLILAVDWPGVVGMVVMFNVPLVPM